jgi:NADH-quinone oxidoreductase subunit L
MTGPLLVLGVLSAVGGFLNVPDVLSGLQAPVHILSHWLEPVTGAATLMVGAEHEASPTAEFAMMGGAVLVALAGIAIAFARCKPAALLPKAQAKPATGFQNVLEHKYYVDEFYDKVIVNSTVVVSRNILWTGIDRLIIDGLFVNGSAFLARAFGWIGSKLQTGQLGEYAWALALGVLAVLGALTLR